MREKLECGLYQGKKGLDLFRIWYDRSRARERCRKRREGSRLVGQMRCESVVCGL
jgi:hypothetical protein